MNYAAGLSNYPHIDKGKCGLPEVIIYSCLLSLKLIVMNNILIIIIVTLKDGRDIFLSQESSKSKIFDAVLCSGFSLTCFSFIFLLIFTNSHFIMVIIIREWRRYLEKVWSRKKIISTELYLVSRKVREFLRPKSKSPPHLFALPQIYNI